MSRGLLCSILLVALLFLPGADGRLGAQDKSETLADLRRKLDVLHAEITRLQSELDSTSRPTPWVTSGSLLQRIDEIEVELRRSIAKNERLEHQIRMLTDSSGRKLAELEVIHAELMAVAGRDLIPEGDSDSVTALAISSVIPENSYPLSMAMSLPPLSSAMELFRLGDYEAAAAEFNAIPDPGATGEIGSIAHYFRGESLAMLGRWEDATVEFLDSFSGRPDSDIAPAALLRLGEGLGKIGQTSEACFTLSEIEVMYPDHLVVTRAEEFLLALGCG